MACTNQMATTVPRAYHKSHTRQSFRQILTFPSIVVAALIFFLSRRVESSNTASTFTATKSTMISDSDQNDIRIVFSDVDGTLVHYPNAVDDSELNQSIQNGNRILQLPPSATGMQGIISSLSLAMAQELRAKGIKLVLVSGMRTSTLLKRLPFLPKADAYAPEAGGRIFILRDKQSQTSSSTIKSFTVIPEPHDGADEQELDPFEIVEDLEWRQRIEDAQAAGVDGFVGHELDATTTTSGNEESTVPVQDRVGALWSFARQLMAKGFVLDTKGYSTCFRVNRKQQTNVSEEDFDALLRGDLVPCPPELATSTNLGCIDYYPAACGKKNCCRYLATKFLSTSSASTSSSTTSSTNAKADNFLSQHCVCLCDDDNDLEMALACQHAFIPSISSTSMAEIISQNPDHFSQTGQGHHDQGIEGTIATEKALSQVLQRVSRL